MAQGTGQVGLAAAAGAGDQQILATPDPVALGQPCDLCRDEVARMLVVDVLYAGGQLEACLSDQALLLALVPAYAFLFDQQREAFGEGQSLVGADLFQLLLQRVGHGAEFELTQGGQGVCCHRILSLRLAEGTGATDVLVVLGQLGFQVELFGQLIPVTLQDQLDLFQTNQTGMVGDPAGGLESFPWIGPAEVEQAETDPVGLFRMGFGFELRGNPAQGFRADVLCPVLQSPRCPLLVFLVVLGHVGRFGGPAGLVLAGMRGHRLLAEVERDQGVAGVQLQGLTHVVVRDRVVMLLVLHVVVDIDLHRLDIDVTVGLTGQGSEGGLIELLKRLAAVARQLLERLLVQLLEQDTDALVQLGQREEGVVAQADQDPALDDLHADLGLGLILWLVGPRRDHRDLIVLGPLLITRIEIGIIATSPRDAALQVVWDDDRRAAAKVPERPNMAAQPVRQCLAQRCLGIGVVGRTQHRHEHRRRMDLAGLGVDDGHRRSTVIDEALLTTFVQLAHRALLQATPVTIAVTELRVAVATVGVLLSVLLPQQLLGHPLVLELLMDERPVGHLETAAGADIRAGIEQLGQPSVIQLRR